MNNIYLFFIFLLSFPTFIIAQEENSSDIIPVESTVFQNTVAKSYRPGLNFQSSSVNNNNTRATLIDSPSVSIESSAVGRIGAIRINGATTPPILGIDGFMIKDPSINQGQFILDLLPYDFAQRVDIYKQNLVPLGINAGSFIDFRIPITFENYATIFVKTSTTANLYTKIQGERIFKDGSTFFGFVSDVGLKDYYFATDKGANFETYPYSIYKRFSFISKTVWKNLEFLLANTYTDSFGETADPAYKTCQIKRNNLITGIRYQKDIFFIVANYTFYNQFITTDVFTNDYLNHQLNVQTGISDQIDKYNYQILLAYEFNQLNDGKRASAKNYKGIPKYGNHFLHIITEFGVSIFKENTNPTINMDFNLSLNQIVSQNSYTPVPLLTIGLRHRNGVYASTHISRVYVLPDFSTAYGFGTPNPLPNPLVKPKDGVRTGVEIGINKANWRVFANLSYSWLDRSFRLTKENTVVNSDNVTAISTEISSEYKIFINTNVIEINTGLAWTEEKDIRGFAPTPTPTWQWMSKIIGRNMDNTWHTTLTYKLVSDVPNGSGFVDKVPRHYLDLNIKYKILIFNLLNLANQSYRPIPNNIYSPFNPGIRAEFGIEYTF